MEKKWRTVIGPKSGLLDMDVKEIWKYRDLCLTFIRKNYITKYKQTVFGPFYMILSPLLTSGIFTVVFGTIAGIATDGIPQFLFYMSGVSFQVVYLRIIIYLATMHISWGRCISQGL